MTEMGDLFREMRRERQDRRDKRLEACDSQGWTRHTPWHWQREIAGYILDYWPGSGLWRWGGKAYFGNDRDIQGFIRNRTRELT